MAYLAKFKDDVFISYAHYDDEPLIQGKPGWVSSLHRTLEVYLRRQLGADPEIWRDIELGGNEHLWDKLKNEISQVAVLVSVISPRYLKSDSCLSELHAFCEVAQARGDLRVTGDKTRLFKVLLRPIPLEKHPPEVKDFIGYEFFRIDLVTNKAREFDPALGAEAEQAYLAKVGDLAHDVAELLEILKSGEAGDAIAKTAGPVVYLAETTSDQTAARDQIRRELQERGCSILPNKPLIAADDLMQAVSSDLARAQFSIHIIGENYGMIPERAERSVVALQHDIALQRSGEPGFTRAIWLPPALNVNEERQRKFIDYLKSDPQVQNNVEFIEGSLDKLKTSIEETLRGLAQPQRREATASREHVARIYLICDRADVEAVAPIVDYLFAAGLEPVLPAMEGDEAQVREDHKQSLATCDAALIYHGVGSDIWLRTKQSDLRKAAGFQRTKPMLAQAICLGLPETPTKKIFRTHEAEVIRLFGGFAPDLLAGFVAKLGAPQKG